MRKFIPYIALATTLFANSCKDNDFKGYIVREDCWEQPGFGWLYRIETAPTCNGEGGAPFVFVGEEEEIKGLDEKLSKCDFVKIINNSTAFSLSGDVVLSPEQIKKINL